MIFWLVISETALYWVRLLIPLSPFWLGRLALGDFRWVQVGSNYPQVIRTHGFSTGPQHTSRGPTCTLQMCPSCSSEHLWMRPEVLSGPTSGSGYMQVSTSIGVLGMKPHTWQGPTVFPNPTWNHQQSGLKTSASLLQNLVFCSLL